MTISAERQDFATIGTDVLAALKAYPQEWTLTPVRAKAPYQKDWTKGTSRKTIAQHIKNGNADGVGIITGTLSGGIVAIDCDGESAVRYAADRGYSGTVGFRSGKPGRCQRLFKIPEQYWDGLANRKVINTGEGEQLEIRWNSCQSVLPPSAHPETEGYQWINSPDNCPIADAPLWVIEGLLDEPKPEAPKPKPRVLDLPDVFPMEICLSKNSRQLLRDGAGEGNRNNSGAALARDLIGTANRLEQLGHHYHGDPRSMFEDFCDRCTPPIAQKERENIWKSAEKSNPGATLSEEALENCIKAWRKKQKRVLTQLQAQGETQTPIIIREEKRAIADQLIDLVLEHAGVTLWHTPDEEAYADVIEDGIRQTFPLQHKSFSKWLAKQFFRQNRKSPSGDAINQAVSTLEALADEGKEYPVALRVAHHEGNIYIDLGTPDWKTVAISPTGWEIVTDAPVRFRRVSTQLPLPIPERGGSLDTLREFFCFEDQDWVMVATWLVNCFKPSPTYPLLILHGEAGSGKSTLTEVLKKLIDPGKAPLLPAIGDIRNFSIAAYGRYLLAYDNLSGINAEQSDALCRLSTGGGFSHRTLHSDMDETVIEFVRPQVINGIDSIATRGDLLDRSILVKVSPPESRRDKEQFWTDFNAAHPLIFGAICDAISKALNVFPSVKLNNPPRMADFAKFGTALEPGLGFAPGAFVSCYQGVRSEAHETALEASPIAQAVIDFMRNREAWIGTASELLEELNSRVDDATRKGYGWAKDYIRLGKALSRLAPDLRAMGIDCSSCRYNQKRVLTLENIKVMSLMSLMSQPPLDKGFSGDINQGANVTSSHLMSPLMSPPKAGDIKNPPGDNKGDIRPLLASPSENQPPQGIQPSGDISDIGDIKSGVFSPGKSEKINFQIGDRVKFVGTHDANGESLSQILRSLRDIPIVAIEGDVAITRNIYGIEKRLFIKDLRLKELSHAK